MERETFKDTVFNKVVTEEELAKHALEYAGMLKNGVPILLYGEVGVGKTTWVRNLLQGVLGRDVRVNSPTFSLMIPYVWQDCTIWHIDLYRLEQQNFRLKSLGIEDYLYHDICIIEWPEYLGSLYPKVYVCLELYYTPLPKTRNLKMSWCRQEP